MKKGIFATALVILLIPVMLSAQGPRAPRMMCKQGTEISDELRAKLAESMLECRLAGIELGAKLEILQIKLSQELMKDDPSQKVLAGLVAKIAGTKEKLHKQCIDHMLVLKSTLKPGQWKMLMKCCGGMGASSCMGMGCCGGGCAGMGATSPMGGCCAGMGGQAVMGMGCGGGGCCGMGGQAVMGKGCCGGAGLKHRSIGMSGCGAGKCIMIEKGRSHMGCGRGMGVTPRSSGSCCPGGMKKMQGSMPGEGGEKVIERRCIKRSSGK